MKKFIFTFGLMILSSISFFAQEKPAQVVKYKAPTYPPAARAVRVKTEVLVIVKIDSTGHVISAKSLGGHPLLRKICENTAQEWIFSSDKNANLREAEITFAFLDQGKRKKDRAKLKKPYRLEITPSSRRIIDTSSYSSIE